MIKVSLLQKGNGLLEYITTSSWHYDSLTSADYEINHIVGILFLSLKFHAVKPEYIYKRINKLKEMKLQILMVLVDVPNYNLALKELFDMVPITIILCRSNEECAKYLRGFDLSTKRSVDTLRNKENSIDTFLESFPKINKTNSLMIQKSFDSLLDLFNADEDKISNIFSLSKNKVADFIKMINMPFKDDNKNS